MVDTGQSSRGSSLDNPARPHMLKAKIVHARRTTASESDLKQALTETELALAPFQGFAPDSLPEGCRLLLASILEIKQELASELTSRSQPASIRRMQVRPKITGPRDPQPAIVRFYPVRPVA